MAQSPTRGRGRPRGQTAPRQSAPTNASLQEAAVPADVIPPGTTGRYLVLMDDSAIPAGVQALKSAGLVQVASSSDFSVQGIAAEGVQDADVLVLETLGVAVVQKPPQQVAALQSGLRQASAVLAVELERIVYAIEVVPPPPPFYPPPPPPPLPLAL